MEWVGLVGIFLTVGGGLLALKSQIDKVVTLLEAMGKEHAALKTEIESLLKAHNHEEGRLQGQSDSADDEKGK